MSMSRVLIVEDESIVAADIAECLQIAGYAVSEIVASGEEGIESVRTNKPDLVLMDIMLQGAIDGIAAATTIRELADIPVVFLTAHADRATLERAKVTEPYGYVLKPFKELELRTVVDIALYRHAQERARKQSGYVSAAGAPKEIPDFVSMLDADARRGEQDQVGILSFMRKIDLFCQLGEDFLRAASQVCSFGLYPGGDFIVFEGDPIKAGFVVVYGRVSFVKTSASGKDLIVELLSPNDTFGLVPPLEHGPYQFSAKAQVDTRILWVPTVVMDFILENYPEIAREFFASVLDRLRRAHNLSRSLAHDLVEVRIASALLALVPRFCSANGAEESYDVRMTRQELAELTGTSSETVSRVVKTMERDEVLDLSEAGIVRILDVGALESTGSVG